MTPSCSSKCQSSCQCTPEIPAPSDFLGPIAIPLSPEVSFELQQIAEHTLNPDATAYRPKTNYDGYDNY